MLNATGLRDGCDESVQVVGSCLDDDLHPVGLGLARRFGADRDRGNLETERRGRLRRRGGGQDDEISARVLRAREENPARWIRKLGDETLLRRHARYEGRLDAVLAQCGGSPRPDGRHAWERAPATTCELTGAARARDDDPV